jgi:hypothetical protein
MALQFSAIETESRFGAKTRSSFIFHDAPGSTRLVVLLPGRGYTCDHPVLHYVRAMALHNGFDVLSVQYGFQAAQTDLKMEDMPHWQSEALVTVEQVFARGYASIRVVGKSLGTLLTAELARRATANDTALIQLTPIRGAMDALDGLRTLAIIGTADPAYAPDVVEATSGQPNITWRVFDGLNHSLEKEDDWRASLAVLPDIIAACEAFILRQM